MVWARTTYMNTKVFINCISNATISQTMRKYNIKNNLSGKKKWTLKPISILKNYCELDYRLKCKPGTVNLLEDIGGCLCDLRVGKDVLDTTQKAQIAN